MDFYHIVNDQIIGVITMSETDVTVLPSFTAGDEVHELIRVDRVSDLTSQLSAMVAAPVNDSKPIEIKTPIDISVPVDIDNSSAFAALGLTDAR